MQIFMAKIEQTCVLAVSTLPGCLQLVSKEKLTKGIKIGHLNRLGPHQNPFFHYSMQKQ